MKMNLSKLFEAQAILDKRIVEEKGLEGQDLLDKKILALQVELGELANEWRGFKFWSENREPNIIHCHACNGYGYFDSTYQEGCGYCHTTGIQENPLLEEYVDCLHFILSIGHDIDMDKWDFGYDFSEDTLNCECITEQFILLIQLAGNVYNNKEQEDIHKDNPEVSQLELEMNTWRNYRFLIASFMSLGKMLSFTPEQIEQAYFEKNKINHERQVSGY